VPDTAQEVRATLSRTLRELDEAIDNPTVSSVLTGLGSLLGVDTGWAHQFPFATSFNARTSSA
jgi:hypothetical protein